MNYAICQNNIGKKSKARISALKSEKLFKKYRSQPFLLANGFLDDEIAALYIEMDEAFVPSRSTIPQSLRQSLDKLVRVMEDGRRR